MKPLSNSNDVYNHLVENSDTDWVIGLLAFSLFEEKRIDWMKHQRGSTGSLPSDEDIRKWYSDQPESVLTKAGEDAENALGDLFEEVFNTALQRERDNIRDNHVIAEIKRLGSFRAMFWRNIGITVISFFVFTALSILLILGLSQIFSDVSLTDVIRFIVREG
ncbi:MAG: hypothetical protein OXH65_05120 [Paracoccaceae bacterium]|nr:hypothetical protein [Paracoccaceae bacterium]